MSWTSLVDVFVEATEDGQEATAYALVRPPESHAAEPAKVILETRDPELVGLFRRLFRDGDDEAKQARTVERYQHVLWKQRTLVGEVVPSGHLTLDEGVRTLLGESAAQDFVVLNTERHSPLTLGFGLALAGATFPLVLVLGLLQWVWVSRRKALLAKDADTGC